MTADFKTKIARLMRGLPPGDLPPVKDAYPPAIQAILRTPCREHRVVPGDLPTPLAASNAAAEAAVKTNGKHHLCIFECGNPAAKGDIYCAPCRKGLTKG